MQTDGLLATLCKKVLSHDSLPWLSGYLSCGSRFGDRFTESRPPKSSIALKQIGLWLFITVGIDYEGTTHGPATDRAAGDPYLAQVRYDWIGPAAGAPDEVSDPGDLDTWAVLSTFYVREYNDVGMWGGHEGSWVESLNADGTVVIREASGRFHDESPESKTTTRKAMLTMAPGTVL